LTRTTVGVLDRGHTHNEKDTGPRQKTDDAVHALADDDSLAAGNAVAAEPDAFADRGCRCAPVR
jgi:hypothetical protein